MPAKHCTSPLLSLLLMLGVADPSFAQEEPLQTVEKGEPELSKEQAEPASTSESPVSEASQLAQKQSQLLEIRSLGSSAALQGFDALVQVLKTSSDEQLQSAALAALGKLNYTTAFLTDTLLNHPESMARSYAAFTLGRMRSNEAVPDLSKALLDKDPKVREHAMSALGSIGNPKALQPLIKAAHKDPNPTLRLKAEAEATRITSPDDSYIDEDQVIAQLKDPNAALRAEAAAKLGKGGSWWAVTHLIEALQDPHPEVRERATASLGELADPRAASPLIERLKFIKGKELYLTMATLSLIKDPGSQEAIAVFLSSTEANTRRFAGRALGQLGDTKAVPALAKAYQEELVTDVRQEYLRSLGLLASPEGVPTLKAALDAKEIETVQIQATWALKEIPGDGAIKLLLATLKHPRPLVRASAIDVMVERTDTYQRKEVVDAIRYSAQNESDAYAREAALEALITLQGRGRRNETTE